jgi:hypothetical protein
VCPAAIVCTNLQGAVSAAAQEAAAAAAYPDSVGPLSPGQQRPAGQVLPWQRPAQQQQQAAAGAGVSVMSNPPASRAAGGQLSISLPPEEYVSGMHTRMQGGGIADSMH